MACRLSSVAWANGDVSPAVSYSAGAIVVFDPLNTLEHSFLNGWRESIGTVLTQQLDRVRQMAKRLSAFTSLAKYVAPDAPLWRTRRIDDALAGERCVHGCVERRRSNGQRLRRCREIPRAGGIGLRRIR